MPSHEWPTLGVRKAVYRVAEADSGKDHKEPLDNTFPPAAWRRGLEGFGGVEPSGDNDQ